MRVYFQDNFLNTLSVLIVFCCFFYISYLTPMQCDDFWYHNIGLSLDKHIDHYLHWSGRTVADYFSCALLQIPCRAATAAIIAFFSTGICYLIVKIPIITTHYSNTNWWKFLVIAALYWIANPQIEDSTFWVVGACNYVVTTFFVLLFLYFFLQQNSSNLWCMPILALVAGCSNENTCLAIIYTMIVLWIISRCKKLNLFILGIESNQKFFFICFSLFVIGASILLLAPGNFERLQAGVCKKWSELSVIGKLNEFMDHSKWNLPKMQKVGEFYLLALLLAGISWKRNRKEIVWSLLFFSTAIVSWIVMVASPYFPDRSLNPTLCFLLLSISFLLNLNLLRHKAFKLVLILAVVWILWLFFKFFTVMYIGHKAIMIQDAIRIAHIKYKKEKLGKHITVDIPQHYISTALRNYRISFPFEFIPYKREATWNGVDALNHIRINYDYTILKTGKIIPVDNRTKLKDVNIYFQPKSLISPQSTILIESSDMIGKGFFLQYIESRNGSVVNIELNGQVIELEGKYYTGFTTENALNLKKVVLKIQNQKPSDN